MKRSDGFGPTGRNARAGGVPQPLAVRVNQREGGNYIRLLLVNDSAQFFKNVAESRAVGNHFQRLPLGEE